MPIHVATGTRVGVSHVTWVPDATGRSPTQSDRSPGHDPLVTVSKMPTPVSISGLADFLTCCDESVTTYRVDGFKHEEYILVTIRSVIHNSYAMLLSSRVVFLNWSHPITSTYF